MSPSSGVTLIETFLPGVAQVIRERESENMSKLHVFDMDGTLLRGASVEEISRQLGCFDDAYALEQSYLRGEVSDSDGPQWWARVLDLWASATEEELDNAFDNSPWMVRIQDVFADISARKEHSVVISQSPFFVVRRLERWGAHAIYATNVEPGVLCSVDDLLTSQDKVRITWRLLAEHGIAEADCVAYGDSTSDVDLFGALGKCVAVNADARIRSMATASYDGTDFWEAYSIGRRLLSEVPSHVAGVVRLGC